VEGLLTLFVALTAGAVVLQAGILLSLYILSKRVGGQVELTLSNVRELLPALKAVTDNLKTVSDDIVEVGSAARQQFHRVEDMIGETGQTLQNQLDKLDDMSRDVSNRLNETIDVVQNSIIRPVREVGALARGVSKGFEFLLQRRDRSPVDQSRQDEELFI
jgi:ABC-type transporter Mla subunit MlaD